MAFGRADVARGHRSSGMRAAIATMLAACLAATLLITPAQAKPLPATSAKPAVASAEGPIAKCRDPGTPAWFHDAIVVAIRVSGDIDPRWADSPAVPRIICWQGTEFRRDFRVKGGPMHVWHGMFAMTVEEMHTIYGAWMTRVRGAFRLSDACFLHGWDACEHDPENTATAQQLIAGLRWIWLNYGTPGAAWAHIVKTGRFDSYPRPGTYNKEPNAPLVTCPVHGNNTYNDDFGERRTVGGYHPHWGNDMAAALGTPIVAPFDGFVVHHSDNWFAGNYVTVVGKKGYDRNGHLSKFGADGYVKAGTVIGYVGATGDASGLHDHFEWHPWVVPDPLHQAPSGFRRVMDAIDPFPYLNTVC
jgi:hypothetical protein